MTSMPDASAVVRTWHEALNAGDLDRFVALVDDDVVFAGPRESGRGVALVRDWAERAGIQMTPERWFARGDAVVVTQQARWRDAETGAWGEPIPVASAFLIRGGRIARVARFETLNEALTAAGLDESAEEVA